MLRRRHNLVFTVVVVLVMIVGALVMAGVLLSSGAPTALVTGTVLAAVPVLPLIACYLWLDRYEPEPRLLLVLGLGWGAFAATGIALVLQILDAVAFGRGLSYEGVIVAPLTEEAAKGAFIVLLLWFRRSELDGILDGIVYAGMVGIGFAFTENILYLSQAYIGDHGVPSGLPAAVGLFVARCLLSPFAHPLFTTFTGIGAGIAVGSRRGPVRLLAPLGGYVLAVMAHAFWNASAMGTGPGVVARYVLVGLPALVALAVLAFWARAHEGRMLGLALADAARRGFLDPAEVPWLVRLPARTYCRRYARGVGGRRAGWAMSHYQTEAIELGYLHHRYLRGTAPRNFAELGQSHVVRMQRLRPELLWPPSRGARPRYAGRTR